VKNLKKLLLCFVFLIPVISFAGEKDDSFVNLAWNSAMSRFRNAATNDIIKVIKNRRSVRAYQPEQIMERDMLAVVEAGLYAPSAKNGQPWHITVIQNQGLLEEMTAMFKEEVIKRGGESAKIAEEDTAFKIFHGAPCAIIVSGDATAEAASIDCAAAVENMLIAAESLGLGTCWMQSNMLLFESSKGAELIKTMKIPDGYKPLYTFSIGYKAEMPEAKPRKSGTYTFIK
jgi:nitroreductase